MASSSPCRKRRFAGLREQLANLRYLPRVLDRHGMIFTLHVFMSIPVYFVFASWNPFPGI